MTSLESPILITGGTGHTGSRLARGLTARGIPVRIGSRTAAIPFDWHDPNTWVPNLQGASAVYLCYSPDLAFPGAREAVAGFAAMAAETGVRRLVLLSGRGEDGARAAEEAVGAVGLEWTVLRCAWFAQNFSEHFLLGPVRRGRLLLPASEWIGEPFLDLDDLAAVAVDAFVRDDHVGQVLELTGPRLVTLHQVAAHLTAATGRHVEFVPCTPAEFADDLAGDGIPREESLDLAGLFTDVLDGRNAFVTSDLPRALGRDSTDFVDYAMRAAATGVWAAVESASQR